MLGNLRQVHSALHRHCRTVGTRLDIEVEDLRRHAEVAQAFGISTIPLIAPFDRRGAENGVGLLAGVPNFFRYRSRSDRPGDTRRARGSVASLHSSTEIPSKTRNRNSAARRAGWKIGLRDPVLVHSVFDQVDVEVEIAGHLDRSAEGDLAVSL